MLTWTLIFELYCMPSSTVCFFFSCSAPGPHLPLWEFPRGNLAIERVIGNGAFGVVSKAYARYLPGHEEWTTVAVKSLQGNTFNNFLFVALSARVSLHIRNTTRQESKMNHFMIMLFLPTRRNYPRHAVYNNSNVISDWKYGTTCIPVPVVSSTT